MISELWIGLIKLYTIQYHTSITWTIILVILILVIVILDMAINST